MEEARERRDREETEGGKEARETDRQIETRNTGRIWPW